MERLPGLPGMVGVPTLFGVVAGTGLLAAIAARARTEHRTDPKAERRLRFWSGPLGERLFTLAGPQPKRRGAAAAGAHAPAATPGTDARDALPRRGPAPPPPPTPRP